LLETLRAYAAEQLAAAGEEAVLRERHARYYVSFAQGAAAQGAASSGMAGMEREHPNLLLALHWCVHDDGVAALQLVAALREFWYSRGLFDEGRRWTQAALAAAGEDAAPSARAAALLASGQMLLNHGEPQAAREALSEAVQLLRSLRDEAGCARALIELGWAVYLEHEEQASADCFAESLALAQQLGDTTLSAHALTSLTHVLVYEGAYTPQLRAYIEESVVLYRRLQDAHGLAQALLNLCTFYLQTGEMEAALQAGRQAQQVGEAASLSSTRAWTCSTLGELLLLQNTALEDARTQLEMALRLFQEASQPEGVLIVQHHLGDLARRQGRWEEAAASFAGSYAAAVASNNRRMMARCQIGLGLLALARGDRDLARRYLDEAQALLDVLPAFLPAAALAELRSAQAQLGK
jgi:tetratricopeptide (TPR) repeat protein